MLFVMVIMNQLMMVNVVLIDFAGDIFVSVPLACDNEKSVVVLVNEAFFHFFLQIKVTMMSYLL